MKGLETAADWEALGMDAERVADALMTLAWYLRGQSMAADGRLADLAAKALGIAETALSRQQVVSAAISHARECAGGAAEKE